MKKILYILSLLFLVSFPNIKANNGFASYEIGMDKIDSISSAIVAKFMAKSFSEILIYERNGEIHNHIVDRGETWESIAKQYGVDGTLLQALNPFEFECVTGIEIEVPYFPKPTYDEMEDIHTSRKLNEGLDLERAGKIKEAIKIYSGIIKDNSAIEAYYLRGRAYYRNHKLKEATADFKYVVYHDAYNKFPDAHDIYSQVSSEWEAYKEQRNRRTGLIIGQILNAGVSIASACLDAKYGTQNSQNFLSGYDYGNAVVYSNQNVLTNSSGGTNYYQNGFEWPEYLNPGKYFTPDVMNVEITFDQFGNAMYSTPGIAAAMTRMQNDFNSATLQTLSSLPVSTNTSTIMGMLQLSNAETARMTTMMRTPQYNTPESHISTEPGNEKKSTHKTSQGNTDRRHCIHCDGTGWVRSSQMAVATFGQHLPKKKCTKCGYEWTPELEIHSCERCKYCDAGKL